ncbi:MAG: Serine--tRNA ligase [Chlamydiae bacterium]|nr:Serine--tRNA ligase [Chlamydiota bacterium]
MLDLKDLKESVESQKKLLEKQPDLSIERLLELEESTRQLKTKIESLKAKRNQISKEVGEKKRKGENVNSILEKVATFGNEIKQLEDELNNEHEEFFSKALFIPNIPFQDIPFGLDDKDNVEIKHHLEKPAFSFKPLNHLELSEKLDLFDFKRGAKVSGSGFPVYNAKGAELEWALINFMIDTQKKHGFEMRQVPLMVRPEMMQGCGQLPKFEGQFFKIHDEDFELYLIPTSESALGALHQDEIFLLEELPKKLFAYTPCFRREAGAHGKQDRGLIRTHQFNKIEMFAYTTQEQSAAMFDEMVSVAEEMLQALGLHYRIMLLCTQDMPFASAKTVDIELWLPGQGRYYECSSISNCTDFQARRLSVRYKEDGITKLVHTLNGSGLATSRLMVSLLEHYQQNDGSIMVPDVLQKYLDGKTVIQ